ncbi:MAG: hypothetical protein AB3A66_16400 [Nodularia sp. CChRGM 3473]
MFSRIAKSATAEGLCDCANCLILKGETENSAVSVPEQKAEPKMTTNTIITSCSIEFPKYGKRKLGLVIAN